METVHVLDTKQRAKGNKFQPQDEMYSQDNGGYYQEGPYHKQKEVVQFVNKY